MFYDRFIRLCADKNISPSKVAEEVGLNRAAVVKWKKGATPSAVTAIKLADYFGVTTDFLLYGNSQKGESAVQVTDENNQPIVLDDDALELIDSLRSRPEMKMLFSVSKKATAEDIIKTVKILEALRDESEN